MAKKRSHSEQEVAADSPRVSLFARLYRMRIAGICLAAVLLLLLVPGYLASRPGFFGRYPSLASKHSTWSTSSHAEAACNDCHVPPNAMAQAAFRARMVGEFYVSLVWRSRPPAVFGKPGNAACLACHNDLRSVSPKGDLQIPHRAHVQLLKMKCVECHEYVVHEKSPEGKNTPTMAGCLKCHDDDIAEDDCNACHTEKAAPASHRGTDWLVVHPKQASDTACAKCHRWAKDWCADCHRHRPRSHGSDWRAVHGEQIKVHRSCEACHESNFCVGCHGEFPKENLDPAMRLVR